MLNISIFFLLESFLDGLYPQDWVTVRSKLLTSFSKHVETFAFSARYVLSRYNYNTLYRTQQSFLKIWLLFVWTLSRFIGNKEFNKKLE